MNNVSKLQASLLSEIFNPQYKSIFESQGMAIYRANLRATAVRALEITFPTIAALLGKQNFAEMSERLLIEFPSSEGDWGVWGEHLPELLSNPSISTRQPYLADCAKLDYISHLTIRSMEHVVEMESLQLLETAEPEQIHVSLAPSLSLLEAVYPVDDIRRAHTLDEPGRACRIKSILAEKANSDPFYFACFQYNFEVVILRLNATEWYWLSLIQNYSLGEALDLIRSTPFSFEQWLASSIKAGMLHRFVCE